MDNAGTIILSIIGGGAFLTFLQFLITRHDGKKEKKDKVLQAINSVKDDVKEFKSESEKRFDQMDRKIDDGQAIQARARILRFSDEVQGGRMFSQEAWNQTFEDISIYNAHCDRYEDFTNSKAVDAIRNITVVHSELLAQERNGAKVFL